MAKTKGNKKNSLSDDVRSKKHATNKKVNPFEVKINRQKHEVLGKKVAKFAKGQPGIARSKAIQKRKETLLVEYKKRGKVNRMIDKRIGENDAELSVEEKMLQRFAVERQRHHEKADLFNLNEDDTLTHYGQSLAEIEKFDEPVVSDDEQDDEKGKIGAKMVAEEHFGGGVLKKADESDDKHKSWKERMEEIIAKSKKAKYERQHEKEQSREMTEQLDQQWKQLSSVIVSLKKDRTEVEEQKKADDFDIAVKELKFDLKATASDKMKTEEELAKEEKDKLEKLETDRLRRMKGLTAEEEQEEAKKRKHLSADDLDDGFDLTPSTQFSVSYKDGKLVTGEKEDTEAQPDSEGHTDDSEGHTDDSAGDSDSDDSVDDDDFADVLGSDDGSDNADADDDTIKEDFIQVLKRKKKVMEEARKEIAFTFKAPETYEDLLQLLADRDSIDRIIIVERIRTCHHPSLAEGNKARLEILFSLLLRYYGDLCVTRPPDLDTADRLVIHLYELCGQSPVAAGQAVVDLVMERQAEYQEKCEMRNGRGVYPTLDMLMYFKLISVLFPTSDLKHAVVTPTLLFMSQIITQSQVQTTRDVALGLMLANLFLEYVTFSKRFVPEAINFLHGLLFLSTEKDPKKIENVIPPFKPVGKYCDLLLLKSDQSKCEENIGKLRLKAIFTPQMAMNYLASDIFRLCCIRTTVMLLHKFSTLYKDLPSYPEIFSPIAYMSKKLPTHRYPQSLKEEIVGLTMEMDALSDRVRKPVTLAKQKAKALKLYEPKVDEDFDPGHKKREGGSREHNEKQRLVHRHKRELKGAIREIRKDSQFLAKQRLDDQIHRDNERKRKVRALFGQLATQEGDFKKMKRMKNKV